MKNIFLFLTLALLVSCAKRDDADIDIRKTKHPQKNQKE